jgi:putative transposase
MRNPLERRYGEGDLHFITFSCIHRRPLLGNAQARDCFVRVLAEVRDRYMFRLIGYVVMPEPIKGDPSKALQVLKQRVSGQLLDKIRGNDLASEPHFWQRRFYDFNI